MADSTLANRPGTGQAIRALEAGTLELPTERQIINAAAAISPHSLRVAINESERYVDDIPVHTFGAMELALELAEAAVAKPPESQRAFGLAQWRIANVVRLASDSVKDTDIPVAHLIQCAADDMERMAVLPDSLDVSRRSVAHSVGVAA